MKPIMPTTACGPLAPTVIDQLASWLTTERYAATTVPQITAVARGLSLWMDNHTLSLNDLNGTILNTFDAAYAPGTPGHAIVSARLPALRRFLTHSGYVTDAPPHAKSPAAHAG